MAEKVVFGLLAYPSKFCVFFNLQLAGILYSTVKLGNRSKFPFSRYWLMVQFYRWGLIWGRTTLGTIYTTFSSVYYQSTRIRFVNCEASLCRQWRNLRSDHEGCAALSSSTYLSEFVHTWWAHAVDEPQRLFTVFWSQDWSHLRMFWSATRPLAAPLRIYCRRLNLWTETVTWCRVRSTRFHLRWEIFHFMWWLKLLDGRRKRTRSVWVIYWWSWWRLRILMVQLQMNLPESRWDCSVKWNEREVDCNRRFVWKGYLCNTLTPLSGFSIKVRQKMRFICLIWSRNKSIKIELRIRTNLGMRTFEGLLLLYYHHHYYYFYFYYHLRRERSLFFS